MLRQIGLISSGAQTWYPHIVASGGGKFAYCATLATYVHDLKDNSLLSLKAVHDKTVSSVTWCSTNPKFFATSGNDKRLVQWDVNQEKPIQVVNCPNVPMQVDWSAYDDHSLAVVFTSGDVCIWDTEKPADNLDACISPVKLPPNDTSYPTCIRWNLVGSIPKLAIGYSDGKVVIWYKESGKYVTILPLDKKRTGEVKNIKWDPLSTSFILVSYTNGYLNVADTDKGAFMYEMGRQNFDVSAMAFITNHPGSFLSANENQAVLYLWNVSRDQAMERIRLPSKKAGINCIMQTEDPDRFVIAFCDGSVSVFSLRNRRLHFDTQPAHAETIYDCAYKPSSANILATASFDGSIKVWDTSKNKCLNHLCQPTTTPSNGLSPIFSSAMAYSVTWAPGGDEENRVATCTSEGEILIWDTKTSRAVLRIKPHIKAALKVCWNPLDPDMLCSTSLDEHVVAFTPKGLTLRKLKLPAAVYGCDFSALVKNQLATGCADSIVRIYDMSSYAQAKPTLELKGHSAKVFNVLWSPLVKNLLASGADDSTIRVWDAGKPNSPKVCVLKGHTNNVRALAWNHEVPWLLTSGSWDGTIRVWDIRQGVPQLAVIPYHHEDVYGLASHPLRPFAYASCARDSSLRFWSLDDTLLQKNKLYVVMNGMLGSHMLSDVESAMEPQAPLYMCGKRSKAIADLIKKLHKEKDKDKEVDFTKIYPVFFEFMSGTSGMREAWELAQSLVVETYAPNTINHVCHINDLRKVLRLKCADLQVPITGVVDGSLKERLKQAANIQLKLGNVKEYCELMMLLGRHERAIALAPAVSLNYWKRLCANYADELAAKCDEEAIPFFIAAGEPAKLVNYCCDTLKRFDDALVAAVTDAIGAYPLVPLLSDEEEKVEEDERVEGNARRLEEEDRREPVSVTLRIQKVNEAMAEHLLLQGDPLLAACCHLAIGAPDRCMQKLVQGGDIAMAAALATTLQQSNVDYLWRLASDRCEAGGLTDEALVAMQKMANPKNEITLLMARYNGPYQRKVDYYNKAGLKSIEQYAEDGERLAKERNPAKMNEALVNLVAGECGALAADVGLPALSDLLSKPVWSFEELWALINPLSSIPLVAMPANIKYMILAYASYAGALQACAKNFPSIASFLFKQLISLIDKANTANSFNGGFVFPVPLQTRRFQEAAFLAQDRPADAKKITDELLTDNTLNPKLKQSVAQLSKAIVAGAAAAGAAAAASAVDKVHTFPGKDLETTVQPSAAKLPADMRNLALSVISNVNVQGMRVILEDNSSVISLAEAYMLVQCMPFSPLLTGARLPQF